MKNFQISPLVGILIGLVAISTESSSAASVYVGLGDSITFGETDLNYVQSNEYRGYVADFAKTLAGQNRGKAPMIVNPAIDGETAASFMSGVGRTTPVIGRTDAQLAAQNLNYATNPSKPQADMIRSLVASESAAGNTINTISITLGFDELGALARLPASQALVMLPGTLATYQTNYTNLLTRFARWNRGHASTCLATIILSLLTRTIPPHRSLLMEDRISMPSSKPSLPSSMRIT